MNEESYRKHHLSLKELFDQYSAEVSASWEDDPSPEIQKLAESMRYSLRNGGKRFRPVLSLMVGELFDVKPQDVLPFALAVESIHTYSLIHDDLPCMDDDDERRGQPTNHKVYGEDIALIAGDGLLTFAFEWLAQSYGGNPSTAISLVRALSVAAGYRGMVGGQAIDLGAQKDGIAADKLKRLHLLKTGCLIEISARGAALIAERSAEEVEKMAAFGRLTGLSFQIADDLLDFQPENPELGNYATVLGVDEARELLQLTTEQARQALQPWRESAASLLGILEFNLQRRV